MHPIGVASAAWVIASAPSKVPFYVAGGALACWAVVLAAAGLTSPSFPGSPARMRLVMLTSFVLVGAALTTAVVTAGEEGGGEAASAKAAPAGGGQAAGSTVAIAADPTGRLAYVQKSATTNAGRVTIEFTNKSPVAHNVTIQAAGASKPLAATKTIQGGTATATAHLAPGRYVFYCSVPGHRQAGMQGTLTAR